MTDSEISSFKERLINGFVDFPLSKHMLRNSEFNATKTIRKYLKDQGLFDYDQLVNGTKKYLDCRIIVNGEEIRSTIRLGFPPYKNREARMWIFQIQKYVSSGERVLLTHVNHTVYIVPLEGQNGNVRLSKERSGTVSIQGRAKKAHKARREDRRFVAYKRDHLAEAKRNAELGLQGELFVVADEIQQLISINREDLSHDVEHKSVTEGDGLGYDILSYDLEANERFIEVKTTKGKCSTPFYISANEYAFACVEENQSKYYLYRVYDFDELNLIGKIKKVSASDLQLIERNATTYKCSIEV